MLRLVLLCLAASASAFTSTPGTLPLRSGRLSPAISLSMKAESDSSASPSGFQITRRGALLGAAAAALAPSSALAANTVGGIPASEFIPKGDSYAIALPEGYKGPVPNPKLKPEEVIDGIVKAMKTNDTPEKNYGLKVAIAFTSSQNPFAKMPIEKFRGIMDGSSYKMMFGGYDKSESKTTDTAPGEAIVMTTFYGPAQKMRDFQLKEKYIKQVGATENESKAEMYWKLSQSEGTNGNWLFDTVYFKNQVDPNGY